MDPTTTSTPPPSSAVDSDTWAPPPPPCSHEESPPLQLPPVPGGGKLRLMCSYGGHIVPRPHDKSLCYVGGDTRIVVADRSSTLSSLCSRLSNTLLHSSSHRRPFTLKYQLPTEDLDSLISLTTDEDLDNMIDEYDRTAAAAKPSRLRLFLFFSKPESAASMGALLDDAKSESWFVDALNGSGLLPRGLSDSAVEDCILGVHDGESQGDFNKQVATAVVVENSSSSFGSSSSSPSMSNLPPIRVRMAAAEEEQKPAVPAAATIEEQFAQISFAPPVSANALSAVTVASDDERSDHGGGGGSAPVVFRKPPLPLQPVQQKGGSGGGGGGGYGLPSPDSVASDTSSSSLSKPMYYQEHHHASDPVPGGTHIVQQPKDGGGNYLVPPHLDQYHHYVPSTAGPVQISPYYQIYPQTPQQQYHHPMDHQYPPAPLYVVPTTSRPNPASAGGIPPVYPTKSPQTAHYVGYSHHPSQSVSGAHNYAFEYATAGPADHHLYYATTPSQYQSMTPATAIALSEAAKQLPSENNNPHHHITTSQPQ